MPAIIATMALVLSMVSQFYCDSVKFPVDDPISDLILHAGPWNYQTRASVDYQNETYYVSVCASYNYLEEEYTVDAKTKTVRAFGILAFLVGMKGITIGYCVPCANHPTNHKQMWKTMGNIFILSCLFQGITLLLLRSSICLDNPVIQYVTDLADNNETPTQPQFPDECERSSGYNNSIAATCLWFGAGVLALRTPPPKESTLQPHDMNDPNSEDDGFDHGSAPPVAKKEDETKVSEKEEEEDKVTDEEKPETPLEERGKSEAPIEDKSK